MEIKITGATHALHLVDEQTLPRMRFGTVIASVRKRLYKLEREHTSHPRIRVIKAKVVDVVKERAKEKARASIKVMVLSAQLSMGKL